MMEAEQGRFGPAGTSHAGMAPWVGGIVGTPVGAYVGSQLDPDSSRGMLAGGLTGFGFGGGLGVLGLQHHLRRLEEAERIKNAIPRNFGPQPTHSPIPAAVTPPPANPPGRTPLTQRMEQGRQAVPAPPPVP